jgi:hypothetical protein
VLKPESERSFSGFGFVSAPLPGFKKSPLPNAASFLSAPWRAGRAGAAAAPPKQGMVAFGIVA